MRKKIALLGLVMLAGCGSPPPVTLTPADSTVAKVYADMLLLSASREILPDSLKQKIDKDAELKKIFVRHQLPPETFYDELARYKTDTRRWQVLQACTIALLEERRGAAVKNLNHAEVPKPTVFPTPMFVPPFAKPNLKKELPPPKIKN